MESLKKSMSHPWLAALLIGLAAQALFTLHLDRPSKPMFDETHYVPAAREVLGLDARSNVEHPMVGKEMIAIGMAVLGDNPIGWRATATVAGTATVIGVFAIVWLLCGSVRTAATGAVLAMLNQTLFIQARIGMLDVFLGAFVIWAIALMLWSMKGSGGAVWRRWIAASALLGLATGVKWAAAPYVAMAAVAFVAIRVADMRRDGRTIKPAGATPQLTRWPGMGTIPAIALLGIVSVTTYFATFLPALLHANEPLTIQGLVARQWEMYSLQTQILAAHPYQSDWWTWPLMTRPMWYLYELDQGVQRGVLLVGNPVIMWGGLIAVATCYWTALRRQALRPLAVALLWTASVAIYAVIPKSLGFYYYYHLSGIFLCLTIAVAFDQHDRAGRRWEERFVLASLAAFAYFYPIISASALLGPQEFQHWMWLKSWA